VDEVQQLLLARIAGDADPAAAPTLPDLLEQALGDDPMAAPLAAAMRKRQAAAVDPLEDLNEPTETQDPEVADVLRRLYAEVESLRARTATLADALGACKTCWGEDASCPACRGRGRAGGRSPEPNLFESTIAPAIRRRRFDLTRAEATRAEFV
jgi:hypothetical protein